jgi:Tol biopolymer transport system component
VNDSTGRKELYVADYDGKNARRLTNDNSIVILPRISPKGDKIVFTSYMSGNPDLYIINTDGTGRKKYREKRIECVAIVDAAWPRVSRHAINQRPAESLSH